MSDKKDKVIKQLFTILDDIDTCSDIAKGNDIMYREIVEKLQKKRWDTGITTDGYTIDLSKLK